MPVFGIGKGLDNNASSCIKSKESEGGQFEDGTSLSSRKITPSLAHSVTLVVAPSLMERRNNRILLATVICDHWGTSTFYAKLTQNTSG
jgi:hypothetical protein